MGRELHFPTHDSSGRVSVTPDMLGNWDDIPLYVAGFDYVAVERLKRRQAEARRIRKGRARVQAMSTAELWDEAREGLDDYGFSASGLYAFDILRRIARS